MKWVSIKESGLPKTEDKGYLVSDGVHIEFSEFEDGKWIGGSVFALYTEVNGTEFEFYPTHYYPTSKMKLPK
jgi:hypothetical protein